MEPETKLLTVEIDKWMDEKMELRQKRAGVTKRYQVNQALKQYLDKKPVAKL
jgi:hypothetical protein